MAQVDGITSLTFMDANYMANNRTHAIEDNIHAPNEHYVITGATGQTSTPF